MFRHRPAQVAISFLFLSLLLPSSGAMAFPPIEAKKGKQYRLTKQHGPWMIMVANFRDIPKSRIEVEDGRAIRVKNDRYRAGQSAQEAADRLVYELRQKGIPAYTFSQSDVPDEVETVDRFGRQRSATFLAQKGRVCVLAGNYPNTNDKIAQRTLKHVKTKFKSPSLEGKDNVDKRRTTASGIVDVLKNGGVLLRTPGKPRPLAGAFLTINPLLTPEEAAKRNRDPLLLKLNAGGKYNLLDNPGQFTLVVSTSYIESKTTTGQNQYRKALQNFQISNGLDDAATSAWQLTQTLREGRVPFRHSGQGVTQRNFDAYVFHDRFGSIVTIGAFNSVNDPLIAEYKKIFGAKFLNRSPNGRQNNMVAEAMTLPNPNNPRVPLRTWVFDPSPRLIEVPKLK